MKNYIGRAMRYIIRMAVIIALIITLLWVTGTLDTGGYSISEALFMSWKGLALMGVIVIFALMYPNISFTTLRVPGNISANRGQIIDALAAYNYQLVKEEDGKMIFRNKSILKRILWQFDDTVTISQNADEIEIEGLKKIVPRVRLRLDSYINH